MRYGSKCCRWRSSSRFRIAAQSSCAPNWRSFNNSTLKRTEGCFRLRSPRPTREKRALRGRGRRQSMLPLSSGSPAGSGCHPEVCRSVSCSLLQVTRMEYDFLGNLIDSCEYIVLYPEVGLFHTSSRTIGIFGLIRFMHRTESVLRRIGE